MARFIERESLCDEVASNSEGEEEKEDSDDEFIDNCDDNQEDLSLQRQKDAIDNSVEITRTISEAKQTAARFRKQSRHAVDFDTERDDEEASDDHDTHVPPYFPKELCSTTGDDLSYDFNRRFFDIPTTIHYDLLTDEQLSQPMHLETFQEVEDLITDFLSKYEPKGENENETDEDQIDKKELFLRSGSTIENLLRSGSPTLDANLKNVRHDCFGNVMILGAPKYSDLSVHLTHGWPRSLIHYSHGGFLAGNITCTAKATNSRIRSMARGDVMAFISTAEMAGIGVSTAELLYYRKAALQCDQRSYRLPAKLLDATVRYGINFATLEALSRAQIKRLGEELFFPYWKSILVGPDETDETDEEGPSDELTGNLLTVNEQNFRDITFAANVQHGLPDVTRAVRTLEQSFRSGGSVPVDGNISDKQARSSAKKRKKPTKKKSAGVSKKHKGSVDPNNSNNNSNQPKRTSVDSSLPETLIQRLNARFYYDKLPSDMEVRKIFEFMKDHKPLSAEDCLETPIVGQRMSEDVSALLNQVWQECKTECTCDVSSNENTQDDSQDLEAGPCPNRRLANPLQHGTSLCPNFDECVPCAFANKIKVCCRESTLTIRKSNAKIFEERTSLAEPIDQLLGHFERTNGVCGSQTSNIKTLAMQILGCQKRLLFSIRSLGQLIAIFPDLATVRITSGFTLFWEVVELLSKAVCKQQDAEMKQHALGRVKLQLAYLSDSHQDRQNLELWFHHFSFTDQEEACLWTDYLRCKDIWSAVEKLSSSNSAPTDEQVQPLPMASSTPAESDKHRENASN